jgi:hypothetical protein
MARKAIGVDALRKSARKERRVVVAQVLAEPAQPAEPVFSFNAKRQQECDVAVAKTANDNRRFDAVPPPDMLLPRLKPVVGLKHGAVGALLEAAPVVFDGGKFVVDAEPHLRRQMPATDVASGGAGIGGLRRARFPERRQWHHAHHVST